MSYYDPKDLRKFGNITDWSEELGTKFFDYYGKVFEEGALSKCAPIVLMPIQKTGYKEALPKKK